MTNSDDLPPIDASQVAPRLWVGAAPAAFDIEARRKQADGFASLAALGLVVDCRLGADDRELWSHRRVVEYVNLGVEDAGSPLPAEFFTEGVERVFDHWTRARSGVLLHCESGAHRSPALALAVLLVDGLDPNVAVRRVTSTRPAARDRYFGDAVRWHATYSG